MARPNYRIDPESLTPAVMERFWAKVDKRPGKNACWLWAGATGKGRSGHTTGRIMLNGVTVRSSRVAFVAASGSEIPAGMVIDHRSCESPLCVRPDHLRLAVNLGNNRNVRSRAGSSSIFKGVSWRQQRGKWDARIRSPKQIYLGLFDDEIEAAKAYDAMAREYFGEYATLNFPKSGERSALTGEIA